MATVRDKNVKKRVKLPQVSTVPSDDILPSPNMLVQKKKINSLPTEVMQKILGKLEIDMLISTRGVCTQWQVLAEDICRMKKSIVIVSKAKKIPDPDLSRTFNGLIDFSKDWIILKVKPTKSRQNEIELSSDFCVLLGKLFPQVENFVLNMNLQPTKDTADNLFTLLDNWSPTLVALGFYFPSRPMQRCTFNCIVKSRYTELLNHINNLTNLKRFVFGVPFMPTYELDFLSRLEHCTFPINYSNELVAIPFLTNCTSLCFFNFISIEQITQFPKLNAPLVKGLTRLSLRAFENEVLAFVCANFGALQMLDMDIFTTFNADAISHLARLSKLSQLSIQDVGFDLSALARSNLSTVNSVHTLAISEFTFENDGQPFDGDQFCRVLSFVFPNLQQLTIKHRTKQVRTAIAQHLGHFVQLRKHLIASK